MILALVTNELLRGNDRGKLNDRLDKHNAILRRVAELSFKGKAGLWPRPTKHEDYENLWGGFTGKYDVFNPSYHVDEGTGKEEVADLMVERYKSDEFKRARYLFLTNDKEGQADLEKFRELMLMVKSKLASVSSKIEVRVDQTKKASDGAELYIGTRDGVRTAVLEMRDAALGSIHGKPQYYLVVHHPDFVDQCLQNHFNDAWDSPEAKVFHIFRTNGGS